MRYNIKLLWTYLIYMLIAGFGLMIPFLFSSWSYDEFATSLLGSSTQVVIWALFSVLLFVFIVTSIKNETNWKKTKLKNYFVAFIYSIIHAAFILLTFLLFIQLEPNNSGGEPVYNAGAIALVTILYLFINAIYGIIFVIFLSSLWSKSVEGEEKKIDSISFAISKWYKFLISGWTLMTNMEIKKLDNYNFNLLITAKQLYLVKILNASETENINLGGEDIIEDEEGNKKKIKIIEDKYLIEMKKFNKKLDKYVNSFYTDNEISENLKIKNLVIYQHAKESAPKINGRDVEIELVSTKNFKSEILKKEKTELLDSNLILKGQIIKHFDLKR